jgi:hypothetical protein
LGKSLSPPGKNITASEFTEAYNHYRPIVEKFGCDEEYEDD